MPAMQKGGSKGSVRPISVVISSPDMRSVVALSRPRQHRKQLFIPRHPLPSSSLFGHNLPMYTSMNPRAPDSVWGRRRRLARIIAWRKHCP
eukprot:1995036-Amphidinium_carterae.1